MYIEDNFKQNICSPTDFIDYYLFIDIITGDYGIIVKVLFIVGGVDKLEYLLVYHLLSNQWNYLFLFFFYVH